MINNSYTLGLGILIWLGLAGLLFRFQWRQSQLGVGLVLAYIVTLSIIHWPATLFYLDEAYYFYEPRWIYSGFEQSLYGLLGFAAGVLIVNRLVFPGSNQPPLPPKDNGGLSDGSKSNVPKLYVFIGLISYFVLFPISGRIPSATAIVTGINQLLVIGLALLCWQAWRRGNGFMFIRWLVVALLVPPLMTLIFQGFIGFGVVSSLIILMFIINFVRLRLTVILAVVGLSYLLLSVAVTYFAGRNEIRASVWGGETVQDRVQVVSNVFTDFEWFDPTDKDHRFYIDVRLNQNWQVGAAVQFIDHGLVSFASGETITTAVLGLIPRIIWPDKPVVAGSPGIVSKYTGVYFQPGTSVGIGQVMEFYINFGTLGVFAGYLIFGFILAFIDRKAAANFTAGNWSRLLLWYLPGLGFIQPGGSLVEIVMAAAGGWAAAIIVTQFVSPGFQRNRGLARSAHQFTSVARPRHGNLTK